MTPLSLVPEQAEHLGIAFPSSCPGWWRTPHATPRGSRGQDRARPAQPGDVAHRACRRASGRAGVAALVDRFGIGFGARAAIGGGAVWGVQSGWLAREWAAVRRSP